MIRATDYGKAAKDIAEAIKSVLDWSAPLLPVKLGWVLIFLLIVGAIVAILKVWPWRRQ